MANGFLKGALIGGVVAGLTGLLLAPKAGSKIIEDILDTYENAQKNGHDFVDTIKAKGASLSHYLNGEEEEEDHSTLLIGGAIGAVIAALAVLLLAPDSGKNLKKILGKQYSGIRDKAEDYVSRVHEKGEDVMEEVNDWKETLGELVQKLSHRQKGKRRNSSKIDDILDLAHVGLNLYKQFQSRR